MKYIPGPPVGTPENDAAVERLRCIARKERVHRCLCCGSVEKVSLWHLKDGRIYAACRQCVDGCAMCRDQINHAKAKEES